MERELLVTDKIVEQILAIRAGGKYNMFDTIGIQREAYEREYYELVLFIEEHKKAYWRFIQTGERGEDQ